MRCGWLGVGFGSYFSWLEILIAYGPCRWLVKDDATIDHTCCEDGIVALNE